jgi:hypothetical protein
MQKIVEIENAIKITNDALKWSPIQFAAKKKELEKTNVLADQVLDKMWEEVKASASAEAQAEWGNVARLREEAQQLFVRAAKMFKVEPAKEACAKCLESWQHGLKALEMATAKV